MKKIFAYTLALMMIICCLASTAFAVSATPMFTIDDFTAARGETVQIPVQISENPGIASGQITLSIPETKDGTPVFTIDEVKTGSWASENVAVSRADIGVYNWASAKNNYTESGEYGVYTVTIGKDVEPGDYIVTIKSSDVQQLTGKQVTLDNGRIVDEFNSLESVETKAILTVSEKTVSGISLPGAKEDEENTGAQIVVNPNQDDKTQEGETQNNTENNDGTTDETKSDNTTTGLKAGATITSSGKTITSSTDSKDTTTTDNKDTKDTSAKTGVFEGIPTYLMICLLAVAFLIPVGYEIKKHIA